MKKYIEPRLNIMLLSVSDVITASPLDSDPTDPVRAASKAWADILGGFNDDGMST